MKIGLLSALLFLVLGVNAQKKIIDHTAYNDWESLSRHQISNDGNFISYEIKPHRGDGYLYIYNTKRNQLDSIYRATRAEFSGNSNYIVFKINPGFDTLRTCELEDIDKKKWPKDTLGIYIFDHDTLLKYPNFKSYDLNEESDWMAIKYNHNKSLQKKKKGFCKRRKEKKNRYESDGNKLHVFNPKSLNVLGRMSPSVEYFYNDVLDYRFSKNGNYIAFTTHQKVETDSVQLSVLNTSIGNVWEKTGKYSDLVEMEFNEQETMLVYLSTQDSSETKTYELGLYDISNDNLLIIADTNTSEFPNGYTVSDFYSPYFTEDGQMIYFGVAEQPKEEPEDTLVDSEKVELDLWHHAENRLQPQQLLQKNRDKEATNLFVYHVANQSIVQLSTDTLDVYPPSDVNGDLTMGVSRELYQRTYNWTYPYGKEDHYSVNLKTGETKMIKSGVEQGGYLSPTGKYYTYYKNETGEHYIINLETVIETCITCSSDSALWGGDINGQPMPEYSLGMIGWSENDEILFVQSRYDVWEYNPSDNKLTSLTNQNGRQNKIRMRPQFWSYDSTYIDFDNVYLSGFDEKTKSTHYYKIGGIPGQGFYKEMAEFDARVYGIKRSKNKNQYALRKMTFLDYPELYTVTPEMTSLNQVSITNPQQSEYNWGTVELVKWTSYEGIELEGLLYKPEDFDESKKYPLMVYFYELYSDNIHTHYIPKPTASIIYATEYASAGYVVFIPNIRYKPGHPGKSAYDCILSGTDHILSLLPNVDSNRMALQGQSWGGYQTAQLVTMTTRYKAAMAGAPVTNMFSAYGGIRWGSGLNRQFQYEHTQSRIGYTIWERPDLYIENSPQFHLPNVETPLLIMHNDGDGAVPWYQGIELFTGLKRLGKETWLLNYNGEQHNLMQNANRIDLSIRMRQFFDYYLQGKAAPEWLLHGIPATKKGIEMRY